MMRKLFLVFLFFSVYRLALAQDKEITGKVVSKEDPRRAAYFMFNEVSSNPNIKQKTTWLERVFWDTRP